MFIGKKYLTWFRRLHQNCHRRGRKTSSKVIKCGARVASEQFQIELEINYWCIYCMRGLRICCRRMISFPTICVLHLNCENFYFSFFGPETIETRKICFMTLKTTAKLNLLNSEHSSAELGMFLGPETSAWWIWIIVNTGSSRRLKLSGLCKQLFMFPLAESHNLAATNSSQPRTTKI